MFAKLVKQYEPVALTRNDIMTVAQAARFLGWEGDNGIRRISQRLDRGALTTIVWAHNPKAKRYVIKEEIDKLKEGG